MDLTNQTLELFELIKDKIPLDIYTSYDFTPEEVTRIVQGLIKGAQIHLGEFERTANLFEHYRYDNSELAKNCNRLLAAIHLLQAQHYGGVQKGSLENYAEACLVRVGDSDASRNCI